MTAESELYKYFLIARVMSYAADGTNCTFFTLTAGVAFMAVLCR